MYYRKLFPFLSFLSVPLFSFFFFFFLLGPFQLKNMEYSCTLRITYSVIEIGIFVPSTQQFSRIHLAHSTNMKDYSSEYDIFDSFGFFPHNEYKKNSSERWMANIYWIYCILNIIHIRISHRTNVSWWCVVVCYAVCRFGLVFFA